MTLEAMLNLFDRARPADHFTLERLSNGSWKFIWRVSVKEKDVKEVKYESVGSTSIEAVYMLLHHIVETA